MREFFRRHSGFGARDRRDVGDLCFHVLRHKRSMQAALRHAGQSPDDPAALLVLARAHLLPSQRRLQADSPLGPAWLARALAFDPVQAGPGVALDLPDWLLAQFTLAAGENQVGALAQALRQPASLDLRVNLARRTREQVQAALRAVGIEAGVPDAGICPPGLLRVLGAPDVERTDAYKRGDFDVQDAGSQVLARLSGARRNDTIVDLCAGAGGKTLAMADLTRDTGNLYAVDQSARRLAQLQPRLQRAGLRSVRPMAIEDEHDSRLARLAGRADVVFIDAPCSGTGTLRRSPDLKWRLSAERVAELNRVQQSLLKVGARLLRPGGRLIYATCSLLVCENETVSVDFERAHPGFRRLDLTSRDRHANGANAPLLDPAHAGFRRIWPNIDGCDGYFAAGWTAADS